MGATKQRHLRWKSSRFACGAKVKWFWDFTNRFLDNCFLSFSIETNMTRATQRIRRISWSITIKNEVRNSWKSERMTFTNGRRLWSERLKHKWMKSVVWLNRGIGWWLHCLCWNCPNRLVNPFSHFYEFVLRGICFSATECIERRCRRPDNELIRDVPDEELIEEIALISEIRNVLNNMLKEVNAQQDQNRAAKQRLEADWSDKKHAYGIETINSSLNNKSTLTLFRPGATRFLDELSNYAVFWVLINFVLNFGSRQSTEERWEHFTKHALDDCEESRQKSVRIFSNRMNANEPSLKYLIFRSNFVQPSTRCSWMQPAISELKPTMWCVHSTDA